MELSDADIERRVADLAKAERMTREGVDAELAMRELVAHLPELVDETRAVVHINGAHGFNRDFVASQMLLLAREKNAHASLEWLRKVSAATEAQGAVVCALLGVNCDQPVSFSQDLRLIPFVQLLGSRTADYVAGRERRGPTAALCRAGTIKPLFVKGGLSPLLKDRLDLRKLDPSLWFRQIEDAMLLLTLLPNSVPRDAGHWVHYDDPDFELLGNCGVQSSNHELPPIIEAAPVPVTQEDVDGLLPKFQALNETDRRRVTLALHRIARARSQLKTGNRALDLAIAFEVLFMNVDQGEHSYKISLRAARLLSSVPKIRRDIFATVRKLYDMRSTMVHTGTAKDVYMVQGRKISGHELVSSSDGICTEAIRRMLDLGGIPKDWAEIEF